MVTVAPAVTATSGGERGDSRPRGPRPDPVPERPKPKRLRPGRAYRAAVLDELPVEQRPIADQVLKGGVPAVREAIAKQNEEARAQNQPEVPSEQLVAMAEQLLPRLRAAEWKDRATAALADLDELDLRDLRSVVVAADGVARDDESKALKEQLQSGLTRRVEEEHVNWVTDITANLDAGRFVRALRLSSRPPKAGTPVPPELSARLVTAVSEGLTAGTNQELWAAAVDALAFSPVRMQVVPAAKPAEPTEELHGGRPPRRRPCPQGRRALRRRPVGGRRGQASPPAPRPRRQARWTRRQARRAGRQAGPGPTQGGPTQGRPTQGGPAHDAGARRRGTGRGSSSRRTGRGYSRGDRSERRDRCSAEAATPETETPETPAPETAAPDAPAEAAAPEAPAETASAEQAE